MFGSPHYFGKPSATMIEFRIMWCMYIGRSRHKKGHFYSWRVAYEREMACRSCV